MSPIYRRSGSLLTLSWALPCLAVLLHDVGRPFSYVMMLGWSWGCQICGSWRWTFIWNTLHVSQPSNKPGIVFPCAKGMRWNFCDFKNMSAPFWCITALTKCWRNCLYDCVARWLIFLQLWSGYPLHHSADVFAYMYVWISLKSCSAHVVGSH